VEELKKSTSEKTETEKSSQSGLKRSIEELKAQKPKETPVAAAVIEATVKKSFAEVLKKGFPEKTQGAETWTTVLGRKAK
jgi:hypothetical protein